MGLFGVIGKVAGSKVFEKVEDELTKKQNREQTGGYCKYIKNNMARVCKRIEDLESETKPLIDEISASKGMKMSFKEKSNMRKLKEKANTKLQYLYLIRDFFTVLSKNASGLILENEELLLVTKFAPFFDGVSVLDICDDEDSDDSVLGAFKEVGQDLKEAFISSKRSSTHFDFDDYLCRYDEDIEDYKLPDINSALESFNNAMTSQEVTATPIVIETPLTPTAAAPSDETECPTCHTKLNANSKFCPECGNKIEIKKVAFCSQCGESITPGAKFCASCGYKIP